MGGFITKKEVIQEKEWIVQTYGLAFYVDCLRSEGQTFLSLLIKWKKI
jgi:hypothetical protein